MIGKSTTEKTTKYSLTQQELESLLMEQAGVTKNGVKINPNARVTFDYSISGGYESEYDGEYRWQPYHFGGLTMTVTEKVTQ